MKISDIIRKFADHLDQQDQSPLNQETHAELHPVGVNWEDGDGKDDESDGTSMIPPLQQKLELLKKAAGVPNAYDSEHDELDDIKKLTGIPSVMIQMDDSDLEGQ